MKTKINLLGFLLISLFLLPSCEKENLEPENLIINSENNIDTETKPDALPRFLSKKSTH